MIVFFSNLVPILLIFIVRAPFLFGVIFFLLYQRNSNQRSRSRSPSRRYPEYNEDRYHGRDYESSRRFHPRRGRGGGGFRGRGRGGFGYRGSYGGGSGFRGSRAPRFQRREPNYALGESGIAEDKNYDNSVFVGNLSFDCTGDDLRDLFSSIGRVISANIYYSHGRSKGMGTVEFEDTADVDEAINQLNDTMFMGRNIFLKPDSPPPNQNKFPRAQPLSHQQESLPQGYEVFIINLPYSATWQDLKDLFRESGDVLRADIELDYNGYSRGFGNVFYATKEEMYSAIDRFNGYDWNGRILEVREGKFNQINETSNENEFIDYNEVPSEKPSSTFTEGVIGGGEKTNLVYISNLPFATSIDDLYDLVESLGNVVHAELKFDETGSPTGVAIVEYEDMDYAETAMEKLNDYNYGGNELSVSYAQRK
ncbi:hypothetical protein KAFR_0I02240 [Kazachstania africana CBS 2517]|uniref:RRM domain-containing protein n=1 Tax=Kazachstania africana (strain ATCC 22294 / BCRC 22015 / CBS 2517 / CECT 1963 / NBRC 1671 / NRRL Y-8276) TaxID=1071382 RepID=H2B053_KAZAF|nr:hypothetical protein KAFR_0I02240 [Kazachstania africana CBS 2517]CCF60003.1 hypothetical protein KAFR_0I02240 [Kazachstania africana CBS 2517]